MFTNVRTSCTLRSSLGLEPGFRELGSRELGSRELGSRELGSRELGSRELESLVEFDPSLSVNSSGVGIIEWDRARYASATCSSNVFGTIPLCVIRNGSARNCCTGGCPDKILDRKRSYFLASKRGGLILENSILVLLKGHTPFKPLLERKGHAPFKPLLERKGPPFKPLLERKGPPFKPLLEIKRQVLFKKK